MVLQKFHHLLQYNSSFFYKSLFHIAKSFCCCWLGDIFSLGASLPTGFQCLIKEIQQLIINAVGGSLLAIKVQLGCRYLDLEAPRWNTFFNLLLTQENLSKFPFYRSAAYREDQSQRWVWWSLARLVQCLLFLLLPNPALPSPKRKGACLHFWGAVLWSSSAGILLLSPAKPSLFH